MDFLFRYGSVLQTAGSESTTQFVFVVIPLVSILILGWLVPVILMGVGLVQKKPQIVSWGIVAAGVMTIMTPLVYYLAETVRREGVFEASVFDFIILALLASVGGAIISLGGVRLLGKKAIA